MRNVKNILFALAAAYGLSACGGENPDAGSTSLSNRTNATNVAVGSAPNSQDLTRLLNEGEVNNLDAFDLNENEQRTVVDNADAFDL